MCTANFNDENFPPQENLPYFCCFKTDHGVIRVNDHSNLCINIIIDAHYTYIIQAARSSLESIIHLVLCQQSVNLVIRLS